MPSFYLDVAGLRVEFRFEFAIPLSAKLQGLQAGPLTTEALETIPFAITVGEGNPLPVQTSSFPELLATGLRPEQILTPPGGTVAGVPFSHERLLAAASHPKTVLRIENGICFLFDGYRREASLSVHLPHVADWFRQRPDYGIKVSLECLLPSLEATTVHASCVVSQEQDGAWLFVAPSGGGKTTVAKHASSWGYAVVGDERIIVRRSPTGLKVGRAPVTQIADGAIVAAPRAVFLLRQGVSHRLESASRHHVLRLILQEQGLLLRAVTTSERQANFALLSDLIWSTPSFELTFERDFIPWPEIQSTLRDGFPGR
ncbi:MAG: hypothetical protein MUF84_18180 [Anaerolineae bacterium]|nr:hypothetical protein [Anaerolineae bacterium]